MSLELVVDARKNGVWLALLKDGKLIELHEEQGSNEFSVGDIYLGKVRKVVPSLNASFVDVGYEKDAKGDDDLTKPITVSPAMDYLQQT